jgi:hypothetical protein
MKCFYVYPRTNQKIFFDDTDVGPYHLPGMSPIQRQGEASPVARWDAEDYEVVERNLEGLTADVSDIAIGEIPRRYQFHTVGVSESFSRFLHRVAREVVCYCERHP